jgi:hypothetical protein
MAQTEKQWVDGLFITKRDGKYGEFLSIGIRKNEFIKYLSNLKEGSDGFINFVGNPRKNDENKYSIQVSQPLVKTGEKPKEPAFAATVDSGDDLPF